LKFKIYPTPCGGGIKVPPAAGVGKKLCRENPTPCGGGVKAVWQKCHTGKLFIFLA